MAGRIENYLVDNGVYGDIWEDGKNVNVEIYWGDWKHDHLRCVYLMNAIGYEQLSCIETETDGGDCYSAIHVFEKSA